MSSFEVIGGKALKGNITPQGAKNEALQILSAVVLTAEPITISNIPDIVDVNLLIELLEAMGVSVEKLSVGEYRFQADKIDPSYLASDDFKAKSGRLRGSVMLAGPILARFKKAYLPKPGGDKIGRRRLDTHFEGFINLGASFRYNKEDHFYGVEAEKLQGTTMLLDEASVTGTANIVMASVLAEGTTTIYNAACEPYLQQLCGMLNSMGAKITGVGSNLLTIEGVESLGGCTHRILPDMIEIGSFIGLAAMTQSEIRIKDAGVQHLGIIPEKFSLLGIDFKIQGDDIFTETFIKFYDAILGTSINVDTPTGKISIKIPPYTSSGKILRVAGKGLPISGTDHCGALLIKINVNFHKLSEDQISLINRVREIDT